jgi:RND family efflux transporter MFP subunit
MKALKVVLGLMLLAAAFLGGFGYGRWYGPREAKGLHQAEKPHGYHCPMHPNFRSDKPGECGICGMRLVPDEADSAAPKAAGGDLASMPAGTIHVPAEKQQLIGVRYGVAEAAAGLHSFRAVGKVAIDETRQARVQSKTEGWIDQVFVNFTGKLVEKGQPLLTLYSPELLASQHEYLLALKSREILRNSTLAGTGAQGEALINASRKRLELWDLSAEQIAGIEKSRLPVTNITLHAPIGGYVMTRNAFPKQRVMPDTELYSIVDLSRVWVMADVFENEISMIREGMGATLTLSYAGGRKIAARVNYIQPQVDPMTRTLKVRLEAENPGLLLKPDMFVDVDFSVSSPRRVSVPADAVLDAGLRKTVFVDRGDGYLEPRAVETGDRIGNRIEILKGLAAGEKVVTSGNFLIDSESQMRSPGTTAAAHDHGQAAKQ